MSQTRMTKQRAIILEVLRNVHTHPTADELYSMVREKLPRISLGTVYRNLDMLAASGEIIKIEKAGVQKRFDGDLRPHFHIRCESCGTIGDVFCDAPLPSLDDIHADSFTIDGVKIMFSGVCDACRAKDQQ